MEDVSKDTNADYTVTDTYAGTDFYAKTETLITINNHTKNMKKKNSTNVLTSGIVSQDAGSSYKNEDTQGGIVRQPKSAVVSAPVGAVEVVREIDAEKIGVETLDTLLEFVEEVDFESLSGGKMKPNDYYIQSIEDLHKVALAHGFDIGMQNGSPHVYNGRFWEHVDKPVFRHFLEAAAIKQEMPLNVAKDHKFVDNLEKQFWSEGRFPVPPKSSTPKLNLRNGTLYFTSNGVKFEPCFDKQDGLTYQLGYDYDPSATAPLFSKFFDEVQPDAGVQALLFQYVAYVFMRHLKLEKILILLGDGENGKSVFLDVIIGLIGESLCCAFGLEGLTAKGATAAYERAQLGDYLLNICPDISTKMGVAIFKLIASREPLNARHPYGRPFKIKEYATSIFSANNSPKITELTGGAFRRFMLVPFSVKIPQERQDKQLAKKIIETEMSGVLNRVIAGIESLLAKGDFDIPAAVRQTSEEFILESDSVHRFLTDNSYRPNHDAKIPLPEMYVTYRAFCESEGCKPVEKVAFSKRARSLGYEVRKFGHHRKTFVYASQQFGEDTTE
jgi:putative DNA primase/helicase